MAFDDALRAARQSAADREAAEHRQAAADALREQGFQEKAEALLREALPHLLPHGNDFVIAAKRAASGPWRDKSGYAYDTVGQRRCWVIGQRAARYGGEGGEFMDCPLVLLEDGTAWRVWCNLKASYADGQFVTSIPAEPLSQEAAGSGDWVTPLRDALARAVVRYERGERLQSLGSQLFGGRESQGRPALGG
ncbi:hypothetical protein [Streptomyces sp. NPDC013489]|uniref:hypothetical protein n=1 Tax=Streptomyces sp. NPDC013489 TaxID=3155606 RepID=UPI0033FA50CF